jgi:putative heme iron utilization protein
VIDHLNCTAAENLVAIDVAKDWNVVLLQDHSANRRSCKFANRKPDHDRLVAFLKGLSGAVIVGLEPTGDYHRVSLAFRTHPSRQYFIAGTGASP